MATSATNEMPVTTSHTSKLPSARRLEIEATLAPLIHEFCNAYGGQDSLRLTCKCLDCDNGKLEKVRQEIIDGQPSTHTDVELEEWIMALRYRLELYEHATTLVEAVELKLPFGLICKDFHLAENEKAAARRHEDFDPVWFNAIGQAVSNARLFSLIQRSRQDWSPMASTYVTWALYLSLAVPVFEDWDEDTDPGGVDAEAKYERDLAASTEALRASVERMQSMRRTEEGASRLLLADQTTTTSSTDPNPHLKGEHNAYATARSYTGTPASHTHRGYHTMVKQSRTSRAIRLADPVQEAAYGWHHTSPPLDYES